jgi:hypothetical protein
MNARDEMRRKLTHTLKAVLDRLEAGGVVLPGDLRAWKVFRKRDTLEQKLISKVGLVQRAQLGHIMELLGDPPNINNLTTEFWDTAARDLVAAIRPLLIEAQIEQAREILEDNPAIGVDWTAVNKEAVDWASKHTFDLVKGINDTSRELLQSSISSYFEQEMTIGDLEGLLTGTFGPIRAEMIAVTEVTNAASRGESEVLHQLQEQGIEMDATWETNDDELVCDLCGPLDGKSADGFGGDGEPYWTDPDTGEPIGPPARHPRCRCWYTIGFKEKE